MKYVTAKEAKNRFGQLIDGAQREPVTISKNGRPFAVVQSYADFVASEEIKTDALRRGIAEARAEVAARGARVFDEAALESLKEAGRVELARRRRTDA